MYKHHEARIPDKKKNKTPFSSEKLDVKSIVNLQARRYFLFAQKLTASQKR